MRRESRASASGTAVSAHRGAAGCVFRSFALLALVGAGLLCVPSGALAARKYLPVVQFPPNYPANEHWVPQNFSTLRPDSVGVSDKNHHIYVADSGRGAVYDLSSATDETPERWNGTTTPFGSFGERVAVAVDNTTGDVYVADRAHAVIDKFDENGTLITSFGDTQPTANGQLAGLETPAKTFAPSTGEYSSFGIAVDQTTHNLYVLDAGHEVIDIFNEEGEYVTQIADKPEGLYDEGGAYASGIAVSSTGNVYVSSWEGPNRIFQFGPSNTYVSTWDGGQLPNGASSETPDGDFSPPYTGCCLVSAGVEDSTGHVFVADFHYVVNVFDANGNFIPPQLTRTDVGAEYLGYPTAVTIDQETGYLFVSQYSQVQVFKPVIVPDVSVNAASDKTTTSATLSGHVDPATGEGGGPVTECRFEYLSVYRFAENGEAHPWNGATQVPCSPTPSNSPTDVSASASGLTSGTEYRFRLVVGNAEGANFAVGHTFGTVGFYRFSSNFGSTGSGDGQLEEPLDVAIGNTTGDIYVADGGNHRVDQFSSAGDFIRAFGADVGGTGIDVCTSGCQAGSSGTAPGQLTEPKFIEVDNSEGPSAGDVYVADGADRIVQKFDSSGNLITGWGNGGEIEFPSREGTIGGITVDTGGNLYVLTDGTPYNWTVIGQDGVSRTQYPTNGEWYGGERLQLGPPAGTGIEVGPNEQWYETSEYGNGVVYGSPTASIYNSQGIYKQVYGIPLVNSGLTFDRATSDLFVAQGGHIDRFAQGKCIPPDAGCLPTDSFGSGQLGYAAGLAARPSNHLLYAADRGNNDVAVFAPVPLPDVTTGSATEIEPTAGTMTGHVDPLGGTIDSCEFEYLDGPVRNEVQLLNFSKDTKEGKFTLTFEGQTTVPISYERSFFEDDTIQYYLEQLSTIGAGGVKVAEVSEGPFLIEFIGKFSDLNVAPITADSSLTPASATLTAETRYDGNGWAYSQTTPCSPAAPISSPTDVSARLTNLTPFNTYHYRLIASRADGEGLLRYGEERGFTPTPSAIPAIDDTSSGAVTPTSATLNAKINPNLSPTVYRFQYGTDTSYGSYTPSSESIGEDNVDHSVSTEINGLEPGRTYDYRVVATNLNGSIAGPDETFSTPDRPAVAAASASDITPTRATLSAHIRPGFKPTTYHFEYGRTAAFGANTPESASIGADNSVHTASSPVSGLRPGTTYHFRVVATNAIGITDSVEQEFTTAAQPEPASPKEPTPCRKGFVKRHGKCVKKKHHKHRARRRAQRHHHG